MEDAVVALARIARELRERPRTFEFFQAVRLLERLNPELDRVGRGADPADEAVRFAASTAMPFPASEIESLEMKEGGQARMTVNFMGLTGPSGVMPYEYTLLIAERQRAKDTAPAAFLDMFHHRIIALFYRAWRKFHFVVDREQGEPDLLASRVLDLVGIGLEAERESSPVPPETLAFYSGLLGLQPRGAAALETLLADMLDAPVHVEQFAGDWYTLPASDWCAVGEESGASSQLGGGAVVGDEVWDPQARVRLRVGPLDRRRFDEFLPGGRGHAAVMALTRFYGHEQYEFEIQLVLEGAAVPGVTLGGPEADTCLGWTTWIRTRPRTRDADETTLRL